MELELAVALAVVMVPLSTVLTACAVPVAVTTDVRMVGLTEVPPCGVMAVTCELVVAIVLVVLVVVVVVVAVVVVGTGNNVAVVADFCVAEDVDTVAILVVAIVLVVVAGIVTGDSFIVEAAIVNTGEPVVGFSVVVPACVAAANVVANVVVLSRFVVTVD